MEVDTAPIREKAQRYDTESRAWASERVFLSVGLTDPEGQDIARILHERIPEAERPAFDVWMKEIKADPSKAPRALAPYLDTSSSTSNTTATATATASATNTSNQQNRQTTTTRVETSPGAGAHVTPDAIRRAAQDAARSGDWSTYEALKKQVDSEIRR